LSFDLHIHSSYSDGQFSPADIILQAKKIGLRGISLTDHDSIAGIKEAVISTKSNEISFITGIELSVTFEDSDEVHLLGYGIDHKNKVLQDKLDFLFQSRLKRADEMIHRLKKIGINLTLEKVKRLTRGGLIGRPHVAQAIAEAGYAFSPQEAFQNYLRRGKPAYVPREKIELKEGVELIHFSGGVAVLAHPGLLRANQLYSLLKTEIIDGLEVYYPLHTIQQIQRYLQLCNTYGLIITGGSDFHGFRVKSTFLGQSSIEEEDWTKLKERIGNRNVKNKIAS